MALQDDDVRVEVDERGEPLSPPRFLRRQRLRQLSIFYSLRPRQCLRQLPVSTPLVSPSAYRILNGRYAAEN